MNKENSESGESIRGSPKLVIDALEVTLASRSVLRNITFGAEAGEWIAVVGPNGAGKSTLLRTLAGLVRPSRGSLALNGADLLQMRPRALARLVTYVPQVFQPQLPFSVVEFVTLGRYRAAASDEELRREAASLLDECGMADFSGRSITELSVGEMQRVLLVAAIFQGGEVLLLDEPASFLDPTHVRAAMELLRRVREQQRRIVITVTHDLSVLAGTADRCVALRSGEAVFVGATRELIERRVLDQVFDQRFRYVELQGSERVLIAHE